ncbi:hypothetical protein SARC_00855 [Sphaeroforma arctica JP610]|uniref:[histone H3]-lysine(36) N-trimethyltransferase n=1 Tax=Sphaeroforma arctica JP610 TaxID=667725 RepID=A0A0L0GDB2_9EUKA|nr:hypothetical protein SARC_00855 [Sphaeroforma arctica JP610]KNC87002.1 hypothetical protein SARC_00855 [Sphaeroforma arctica JP610]|eukprot:XP_014160904.1 hypothetical protein SARC_00855 [Sphaeroforma arctica JP610]
MSSIGRTRSTGIRSSARRIREALLSDGQRTPETLESGAVVNVSTINEPVNTDTSEKEDTDINMSESIVDAENTVGERQVDTDDMEVDIDNQQDRRTKRGKPKSVRSQRSQDTQTLVHEDIDTIPGSVVDSVDQSVEEDGIKMVEINDISALTSMATENDIPTSDTIPQEHTRAQTMDTDDIADTTETQDVSAEKGERGVREGSLALHDDGNVAQEGMKYKSETQALFDDSSDESDEDVPLTLGSGSSKNKSTSAHNAADSDGDVNRDRFNRTDSEHNERGSDAQPGDGSEQESSGSAYTKAHDDTHTVVDGDSHTKGESDHAYASSPTGRPAKGSKARAEAKGKVVRKTSKPRPRKDKEGVDGVGSHKGGSRVGSSKDKKLSRPKKGMADKKALEDKIANTLNTIYAESKVKQAPRIVKISGHYTALNKVGRKDESVAEMKEIPLDWDGETVNTGMKRDDTGTKSSGAGTTHNSSTTNPKKRTKRERSSDTAVSGSSVRTKPAKVSVANEWGDTDCLSYIDSYKTVVGITSAFGRDMGSGEGSGKARRASSSDTSSPRGSRSKKEVRSRREGDGGGAAMGLGSDGVEGHVKKLTNVIPRKSRKNRAMLSSSEEEDFEMGISSIEPRNRGELSRKARQEPQRSNDANRRRSEIDTPQTKTEAPKVTGESAHEGYELLESSIRLVSSKEPMKRKEANMVCDCTYDNDEDELEDACGPGCLNRIMRLECRPELCPCGSRCQNQSFHKGLQVPLEVYETEKKGRGLRSPEKLTGGSFVMEYVGEIIGQEQFKERLVTYGEAGIKHFYFMTLGPDEFIDATKKGSPSRFFNHSCDPNCETQKWVVDGETRIGIYTTRDVEPNEELTFDYQMEREGELNQKCHCESKNCRNWLSSQKKRPTHPARGQSLVDVEPEKVNVAAAFKTLNKHNALAFIRTLLTVINDSDYLEDGMALMLCLDPDKLKPSAVQALLKFRLLKGLRLLLDKSVESLAQVSTLENRRALEGLVDKTVTAIADVATDASVAVAEGAAMDNDTTTEADQQLTQGAGEQESVRAIANGDGMSGAVKAEATADGTDTLGGGNEEIDQDPTDTVSSEDAKAAQTGADAVAIDTDNAGPKPSPIEAVNKQESQDLIVSTEDTDAPEPSVTEAEHTQDPEDQTAPAEVKGEVVDVVTEKAQPPQDFVEEDLYALATSVIRNDVPVVVDAAETAQLRQLQIIILRILSKIEFQFRNPIDDGNMWPVIKSLAKETNKDISDAAGRLITRWSSLRKEIKIPKKTREDKEKEKSDREKSDSRDRTRRASELNNDYSSAYAAAASRFGTHNRLRGSIGEVPLKPTHSTHIHTHTPKDLDLEQIYNEMMDQLPGQAGVQAHAQAHTVGRRGLYESVRGGNGLTYREMGEFSIDPGAHIAMSHTEAGVKPVHGMAEGGSLAYNSRIAPSYGMYSQQYHQSYTHAQGWQQSIAQQHNDIPDPRIQPLAPPEEALPAGWMSTMDPKKQRVYYYHVDTNQTQWTKPTADTVLHTIAPQPSLADEVPASKSPTSPSGSRDSLKRKSEAADKASESAHKRQKTSVEDTKTLEERKRNFRAMVSKSVIKVLGKYNKPGCKFGRITNKDDFKHLARKITHMIVERHTKKNDFSATEAVHEKLEKYIHKSMKKQGSVYTRKTMDSDIEYADTNTAAKRLTHLKERRRRKEAEARRKERRRSDSKYVSDAVSSPKEGLTWNESTARVDGHVDAAAGGGVEYMEEDSDMHISDDSNDLMD